MSSGLFHSSSYKILESFTPRYLRPYVIDSIFNKLKRFKRSFLIGVFLYSNEEILVGKEN